MEISRQGSVPRLARSVCKSRTPKPPEGGSTRLWTYASFSAGYVGRLRGPALLAVAGRKAIPTGPSGSRKHFHALTSSLSPLRKKTLLIWRSGCALQFVWGWRSDRGTSADNEFGPPLIEGFKQHISPGRCGILTWNPLSHAVPSHGLRQSSLRTAVDREILRPRARLP